MRGRLVIALLVGLLGICAPVAADSSVPQPKPPQNEADKKWEQRCADRLRAAQRELVREDKLFELGTVSPSKKERGVEFEALVPDPEHGRFYKGAPARFVASVVARASKEAGSIGGTVGAAKDSQASLGWSSWSRERFGTLDAQIADGQKVFRFQKWFELAINDCLKF